MDILQEYDSDKMFPVYGFGGILPDGQSASQCFALNGDIYDPKVNGKEGILDAYENARDKIKLSGPTMFSKILRYVYDQVQSVEITQENQYYNICLIFTDGTINDMEKTRTEIVRASYQPISIIIVGVGQENFGMMRDLDGDNYPLYSKELDKPVHRDIVQFVDYKDFQEDPEMLAQEILAEVPKQVTDYFISQRITSNAPLSKSR